MALVLLMVQWTTAHRRRLEMWRSRDQDEPNKIFFVEKDMMHFFYFYIDCTRLLLDRDMGSAILFRSSLSLPLICVKQIENRCDISKVIEIYQYLIEDSGQISRSKNVRIPHMIFELFLIQLVQKKKALSYIIAILIQITISSLF